MSIRYRWFEIGISSGFRDFIDKLEGRPFVENSTKGFRIIDVLGDTVECQYIWKSTVYSTNINDEGDDELIAIDTTEIVKIFFMNINKKIFLKVENPTKSLKSLMTSLESIVSLGFYQKPVIFNYGNPDEIFSNFDKVLTTKLVVSGLSISQDVIAKMELTSVKGIQIDRLQVIKDQKYTIDLIAYEVMYKHVTSSIVFSKSGLVRIKGDLMPKIRETLELALLSNTQDDK